VDAGVREGQSVGTSFDPMIAKIICHGNTRSQAIERSAQALEQSVLLGLTTNARYLTRVLRHAEFRAGQADTDMLARCADELRESLTPDDIDLVLASAVLADRELLRAMHAIPAMHAAMGPWRN